MTTLARVFELPTIPAEVRKLRDDRGRIWTADRNRLGRIWRHGEEWYFDHVLLATVPGPFQEVTR